MALDQTDDQEQVVLLGDDGQPVGTAPKASVHTTRTPLHLAFSCYVFDDAESFLLTRRSLAKPTWPGVWTNSCCGHPAPGEPVARAVARRLRAELGIDDARLTLLLPDFRYRAVMDNGIVEHELCPVYRALVPAGAPTRPDPAEVADHRWVPWPGFCEQVRAGTLEVSPWTRLQLAELARIGTRPLQWRARPA